MRQSLASSADGSAASDDPVFDSAPVAASRTAASSRRASSVTARASKPAASRLRTAKTAAAKSSGARTAAGARKPEEPSFMRSTHSMILRQRASASPGGVSKKRPAKKAITDLTIPKPFNLRTNARKKGPVAAVSAAGNAGTQVPPSPYVPLAAKIEKFLNKTPERFRTRVAKPKKDKQRDLTQLTQPKSPFLSTKLRSKPSKSLPTQEEREEEELRQMEHFKAKPVNKRILLADGPLGVPEVPRPALTVPMSPAITKPKPPPERPPSPERVVKAHPIPDLEHPFQPRIEHRKIEPVDFELPGDAISRRKHQEFLAAVEKEKAERERERRFVAHPILSDVPIPPPAVPAPQLTEPKPFALMTDLRGAIHQSALEQRLAREQEAERQRRAFHANPLPDAEPFVPKKSDKPLTEIQPIVLHTDVRAHERSDYEETKRQRELEEERLKTEAELLRQQREAEELKNLRKQITHKAQPVRHFAPVHPQPSSKKLTEPQSPMIGAKRQMAKQAGPSGLGSSASAASSSLSHPGARSQSKQSDY
ncbi:hypothetical protein HK105_201146 [Polyrhizophydium stewartii]|uniref:TPX2 C-terminal domain-containing protein n=1 Tax=Polyrhizophydium stewartii TaxID=2732419 RepID=A0ABR4NJ51_9FUNG